MSAPFGIVGDEAVPLNKHLMKPYERIEFDDSKRIFNYRLSRFRRCSENVFRIIAARFPIVNSPINLAPEKVAKLVLAIAVLHNFLLAKSRGSYLPSRFVDDEYLEIGEVIPGEWRQKYSHIYSIRNIKVSKNCSVCKKRHFKRLLYGTRASRVAVETDKLKNFPVIVSDYLKKHTTLIIKCETF